MKTHEHAIISLGYAAGVSLFAGNGFSDPLVYITAVTGGEVVDFIDHPLYHLVYNRNNPHVRQARYLFSKRKWKEAIAYLIEVEEKREFKGLILHNVYTLTIISVFSILGSLVLSGSPYLYIFVGSLLLHMLTDIFGDFQVLGHFDNWLWVLSPGVLRRLGRIGDKLVFVVILWFGLVLLSFFLVSFRWGWQLAGQSGNGLLFEVFWRTGAFFHIFLYFFYSPIF